MQLLSPRCLLQLAALTWLKSLKLWSCMRVTLSSESGLSGSVCCTQDCYN